MENLKNLTVEDFIKITASDAPAPGGGSISALAGALGAALAEMVGRLTVGREKYASSQEAMEKVVAEAEVIRLELTEAIHKDSASFNQYMDALSLPKGTDEEKAVRRAAMQEGLKAAARVPMSVAEAAAKILPLAELAVTVGNPNAVTDGLVATMMARSAILGALFNVKINLESIKDQAFVDEMSARVQELTRIAVEGEKKVFEQKEIAQGIL